MSAFAQEDKDDAPSTRLLPPNTARVQRMRIKRQTFELNANQIESFAHIWITTSDMKASCTYIVLSLLFEVHRMVRHQISNAWRKTHPGADLHLIDASRHKFGPLLASNARFFGISGTHRWKV
jgi:hypothetical protein